MAMSQADADLKLKLELRQRQLAQQSSGKGEIVTPESSWSDTMRGAAANVVPSLKRMGTEAASRLMDIPGSMAKDVKGVWDIGAGGLEGLYGLVGANESVNKLNNWLADQGIPLEKAPNTSLSPTGERARQAGQDLINTVRHPIVAAANDPASAVLNIGSLVLGGTGRIPRMAKENLDLNAVLKNSETAKNAEYTNTYNFPGEIDTSNLGNVVKSTAEQNRYDSSIHSRDYPGLEYVSNYPHQTTTLAEVAKLRKELENRGERYRGGPPPDSGLIGKVKDAFDAEIARVSPEGSAQLEAERAANVRHETTKGLADALTTGRIKGTNALDPVTAIKRNVIKEITDPKTKIGYSSDLKNELMKTLEKYPKSRPILPTVLSTGGATLGGLLGSFSGPVGGAVGAASGVGTGLALSKAIRSIAENKALRGISGDLEGIIGRLNGLPPAQQKLEWNKLDNKTRALLLSAGVTQKR